MGQLYRKHRIFVMAERYVSAWIPTARVMWLAAGRHQQIDLIVTDCFETKDKAEERGLSVAKSWVDNQFVS